MSKTKDLRVVHVDDNEATLSRMKGLLENESGIEYLAGFRSADEALPFLNNESVDLLLLDIELPGNNGLWLAEQLQDNKTEVVFVTSYAGYAAKAFEVCALDYLLKPMDKDKLHIVLEKFRHKRAQAKPDIHQQIEAIYQYLDPRLRPTTIFINGIGRTDVIRLDDIIYFIASGSYTTVVTEKNEQFMSSRTIKTYEDALKQHPDFVRISRSVLINKNYIKAVERQESPRRVNVIMANKETLETSFKTKEALLERIAS